MAITVNAFIGYLAQSLQEGGSETTFYLSTLTTLTGETIATADFATFGRGTITIDPLSQANIEFASFTGVDGTAISLTGGVRGLSAKGNTPIAANKKYHPVGTQVIIAFGVHNLEDLKDYIDDAITGSVGTASDTTAGTLKTSELLGKPRAMACLVSEQSSPDMTLKVNPFSGTFLDKIVNYTGGNTATLTAPVSNPRIDLVVYDTTGSAMAVRAGSESASPSEPTPTDGDIVLASVYHTTTETSLKERNDGTNGYIKRWYQPNLYSSGSLLKSTETFQPEIDGGQYASSAGTVAFGEANLTTKYNSIAQSYVPTRTTKKRGCYLYKKADTGTFTGDVCVYIKSDSAGTPGTTLGQVTIPNAVWAKIPVGEFNVVFSSASSGVSLTAGTTYWIMVQATTSDNSNHPNLGSNASGGYSSGIVKFNNTADGWVTIATIDLYFYVTESHISRIVKTSSASDGMIPSPVSLYSLEKFDTTNTTINTTAETNVFTAILDSFAFGYSGGFKLTLTPIVWTGSSIAVKLVMNGTTIYSNTYSKGTENSESQTTIERVLNLCYLVINNDDTDSQKYLIRGSDSMHYIFAPAGSGDGGLVPGYNPGDGSFTSSGISTPICVTGTSAINTYGVPIIIELYITMASGATGYYKGAILERIG
mgnify:CR=1 FL=1